MLSNRYSSQFNRAVLLGNCNQRKIGGTATDIDNQYNIPHNNLFAPGPGACLDPTVQSRLWLLEQYQLF